MQILINLISAIVGLQGSSIDPAHPSARLTGLYVALASGLVALLGHFLPTVVVDQAQAIQVVSSMFFVGGFIWSTFGALRAAHVKVAGILKARVS